MNKQDIASLFQLKFFVAELSTSHEGFVISTLESWYVLRLRYPPFKHLDYEQKSIFRLVDLYGYR
jgi:hypothetical protein